MCKAVVFYYQSRNGAEYFRTPDGVIHTYSRQGNEPPTFLDRFWTEKVEVIAVN